MISLERSTFRVVKDCAVDCITAVTVMEAGVPHQVIIDAMDLYGNKRTTGAHGNAGQRPPPPPPPRVM